MFISLCHLVIGNTKQKKKTNKQKNKTGKQQQTIPQVPQSFFNNI